jgi:protein-L-isoaspartate(D-aspartate) O-methyltransferase
MDLRIYGSAQPFVWTHAHLIRVLISGARPVLKDPLLINAFRLIDRAAFVPEEYQDMAYQDKNIPIGYNEVTNSPSIIATQLELLQPRFGGRYLHIGSGSGYLPALLGFVAGGNGKVYTLERIQWLWERARTNIRKYPQLKGMEILLRDGRLGLPDQPKFDGIIVSGSLSDTPMELVSQLTSGGRLVYPTADNMLRTVEKLDNEQLQEEIIPGFYFEPLKPGLA